MGAKPEQDSKNIASAEKELSSSKSNTPDLNLLSIASEVERFAPLNESAIKIQSSNGDGSKSTIDKALIAEREEQSPASRSNEELAAFEAKFEAYPHERESFVPDFTDRAAPDQPVPRDPEKWHNKHNALVEKAKTTDASLVFYGDSITEGMSEGNALKKAFGDKAENFGIIGDSTQHLLWRLQNGEADFKKAPETAVLLIGANNIGAANNQDIVKGIIADAKEMAAKMPGTRLLVLGVLPQGKTAADPRREQINKLNAELETALKSIPNLSFFNVGPQMLEKDGSMSPKVWWGDGLHPRDYTRMFDAIKAELKSLNQPAQP